MAADLLIYRLCELLQGRGTSFMCLTHEAFGESIMSMNNTKMKLAPESNSAGDRIHIEMLDNLHHCKRC